MPSLKDIKRRIVSVKNTQKITHAMKLVSAAKFARANHAVLTARPYGDRFEAMVSKVVAAAGDVQNPLTEPRGQHKRELLILIATDRGLCGSLNSGLFKLATRFHKERLDAGTSLDVMAWGRRAGMFARKVKWTIVSEKEKVSEKPRYDAAKTLSDEITKAYLEGTYDGVFLAFVEFKSALSQVPVVKKVLPLTPAANEQGNTASAASLILEPGAKELLNAVIEKFVSAQIFRVLLEAAASEHGARMTSMDSATKNAKEVIRKLTLQYNRGRQAAITKELIEITSGAEAL